MKYFNSNMSQTLMSAQEIAIAVGTSTASVSRAFRPDTPMSKPLRDRILAKAQDLGYVPPGARVSRKSGRMSVSLVVGDITNPYYAYVLSEFSTAANERGIELFFHVVPSGRTVDATMQQVFAARRQP
jgi:DNA-binding LacI/PurR family transcriptional regulator